MNNITHSENWLLEDGTMGSLELFEEVDMCDCMIAASPEMDKDKFILCRFHDTTRKPIGMIHATSLKNAREIYRNLLTEANHG